MARQFSDMSINKALAEALEKSKSYVMTAAEIFEQRVSWVYGNLAIGNPDIKKEDIYKAAYAMYGQDKFGRCISCGLKEYHGEDCSIYPHLVHDSAPSSVEGRCKCGHLQRWHDTNGTVCEYRGCQCAEYRPDQGSVAEQPQIGPNMIRTPDGGLATLGIAGGEYKPSREQAVEGLVEALKRIADDATYRGFAKRAVFLRAIARDAIAQYEARRGGKQ